MANINIADLHTADYETFFDAELTSEEVIGVNGGGPLGHRIGAAVAIGGAGIAGFAGAPALAVGLGFSAPVLAAVGDKVEDWIRDIF